MDPSSSSSSSSSSPSPSSSSSSSTPSSTSSPSPCSTPSCPNPASLTCPTCLSLSLSPPSKYCSQDCFKSSWKAHNALVHKPRRDELAFSPPPFPYTGPLRPHYVSPMRTVPDHINKPDYWASGEPASEYSVRGNTAIYINSKKDIEGIRAASKLGREALDLAHSLVRAGITTEAIDRAVHEYIVGQGAYPSPLNYKGFPKACCTSVNEVICHGIPDARPLQEGDLVNVDVSVFLNGYHSDLNETFPVGQLDDEGKRLLRATYECLEGAIRAVRPGAMCREFGEIISKRAHRDGFSVVRAYCGHGVGALFHSLPNIPHYAKNKAVGVLREGMVFTIEPMINVGTWKDVTWPDDWTSTTADGKRSAQFEHTLLVTATGVEVLTARTAKSPKFFWEKEKEEGEKKKEKEEEEKKQ